MEEISPRCPSSHSNASSTSSYQENEENATKSTQVLRKCMSCFWNVKCTLMLILVIITVLTNIPSMAITTFYSHNTIRHSSEQVGVRGMKYILNHASSTMKDLVTILAILEEQVEHTLTSENITISNFSTNHMHFHFMFLPFVKNNPAISSIGFTFNSGGIVVVRKGPEYSGFQGIEKTFTEWVNGSRYTAVYRMDPDSYMYTEKQAVVKQFYSKEYCTCNLAWFNRESRTVKWNVFVSKFGVEIIYPFKSIYQNGEFVGKLAVIYYLTELSNLMNELDEITFMFTSDGSLVACSTFLEDSDVREVKIYKVHEYVNEAVRDAGLYLLAHNENSYANITESEGEYLTRFDTNSVFNLMKVGKFTVEGYSFTVVSLFNEAESQRKQLESFLIKVGSMSLAIVFCSGAFIVFFTCIFITPLTKMTKSLRSLTDFKAVKKKSSLILGKIAIYEITELKRVYDVLQNVLMNFGKFLPQNLLRKVVKRNREIGLELKSRKATCVFIDMVDFTAIAEKVYSDILIIVLQKFFQISCEVISECGGIVDKFIGDEVLGLFKNENHAFWGVEVTLRIFERIKKFNEDPDREIDLPLISVRAGINTGRMLLGFVGWTNRMSYTCIGDVVNIAGRLQPLNKVYCTQILVGENTYKKTHDKFVYRWINCLCLRGKKMDTDVYTVIGRTEQVDEREILKWEEYNKLKEYIQKRDVSAAKKILESFPVDKITEFIHELIKQSVEDLIGSNITLGFRNLRGRRKSVVSEVTTQVFRTEVVNTVPDSFPDAQI